MGTLELSWFVEGRVDVSHTDFDDFRAAAFVDSIEVRAMVEYERYSRMIVRL